MMIEMQAAGRSLHSRYNPRGEAERYIKSLSLQGNIRYFILIEPGLGYIIPLLRGRFPGAKIIALHLSGSFVRLNEDVSPGEGPHACWSPGSGVPVQQFLEGEIPETGAAAIKIVEWRPALGVFGENYLRLLRECTDFIKRTDAGEKTRRQFGRRWFKNFFKNILLIQKTFSLPPFSIPLVITGAGPSLENAIPLIKRQRERIFVLAVSSSAGALEAGGIIPDLLISTDGGNWALSHLYGCLRLNRGGQGPALAVSVNAALPSQCAALPLLFISDGGLWQRLVLEGYGIPFLSLPQRGTVSAAALDLAFILGRGKVFITGLDFSVRDIRTHARPYAFDRLWEGGADRFKPVYHQHFIRSGEISSGGSQGVYAAWFAQQLDSWPKRIFALGGNNPVFKNLEIRDVEDAAEGAFFSMPGGESGENGVKPAPREIPLDLPGDSRLYGVEILQQALRNPQYRDRLFEELGPLLCPEREIPSLEDLERAMMFRGNRG